MTARRQRRPPLRVLNGQVGPSVAELHRQVDRLLAQVQELATAQSPTTQKQEVPTR